MAKKLYYCTAQIDSIEMMFAHTEEGLAFVDNLVLTESGLKKRFPHHLLIHNHTGNLKYISAFQDYFAGRNKKFIFKYDLKGTAFQQEVWRSLLTIPFGETRTYKQIAQQIGRPTAFRAVGGAIGKNPVLIAIPCHRVIGSNHNLTGFRGGLVLKAHLLDLEKNRKVIK